MRNLAGHKVLLILRNPGGMCRNIYGREQLYPPHVINVGRGIDKYGVKDVMAIGFCLGV
jgi:hypothetical protein